MLPMPAGLDGRFSKMEKGFSLFVMRPIIFSAILGSSLPSVLVNPALRIILYCCVVYATKSASRYTRLGYEAYVGVKVAKFLVISRNKLH